MRRFAYENGLSLCFLGLFLLSVIGQSIAGLFEFNDHRTAHEEPTVSYFRYVASSDFGADLLENWQSEWLQFWVFALATVWLVQKGSNSRSGWRMPAERTTSSSAWAGSPGERAPLGEGQGLATHALLQLLLRRNGLDPRRNLACPVVRQLDGLQRRAAHA